MKKTLMVKVKENTHQELMRLKYKLKKVRSASETIQYLLDYHKKKK